MNNSHHLLREFDRALSELDELISSMASLCIKALDSAFDAVLNRSEQAANRTIADDDLIDQLELEIDRKVLELQASFVPVANDLHALICAMRFSSPLERIGDEASGIAKKSLILMKLDEIRELRILEPAYHGIKNLISCVTTSYMTRDGEQASACLATCDRLEESIGRIADKMMELAGKYPERIAAFTQAVLIVRSLSNILGALHRMASDVLALGGDNQLDEDHAELPPIL